MSWVLQEGPYHTACSPIKEDAAYKQTVLIPLDKAEEPLEEAPLPPAKLSKGKRALIVFSGLWLILVLVLALNINDGDAIGFFTGFSVFGLIPVGLAWGIIWVRGPKRIA